MIIIHGENTIKSRQRLTELIQKYKEKNTDIIQLSAKSLTVQLLAETLGSVSLFGVDKVIVIEELHSLPESAKKKELIALLVATSLSIILWEKRLLTKTMLNKFKNAEVETFKASSILFSWLDSIGSTQDKKKSIHQLHQIVKEDSAQFCFTMVARQVRLLISILDDGRVGGAPFMISKLRKQARYFSLNQLISIHSQLVNIDYKQKRSLSKLSLEQELDLLILSL